MAFFDEDLDYDLRSKSSMWFALDPAQRSTLQARHRLKSVQHHAIAHSYKIEFPSHARDVSSSKRKKKIQKQIFLLQDTIRWGIGHYSSKRLDHLFIQQLAAFIEPASQGIYRREPVRILGSPDIPPSPEKVPTEMVQYFVTLRDKMSSKKSIAHIESAFYAHLHLARIHPFQDGNGRTARALQDIILDSKGLPPPIIAQGERIDYFDHLTSAILAYKDRKASDSKELSKGERNFYNYMGGKLNESLNTVLGL